MTNKCRTRMVKKELYNVREHPQEGGGGGRSPFALCSMKPGRNLYPWTVNSSPQIMSLSSSVFQAPIQSFLTSALTIIRLIET